jgi:hypothetical protein
VTHTENNELPASAGGYTVGELVDVTIRGARVLGVSKKWASKFTEPPALLDLEVSEDWHPVIDVRAPGVTVARVAPAEWPPRPADVWYDRNNSPWAVLGDAADGSVEMRLVWDRRGQWLDPAEVLGAVGPMRLEYRPGWSRQPDPVPAGPAEPGEVDERAEKIAGLRELANLLDRNPALTVPYRITVGTRNADDLRAWAFTLGVDATANPHNDTIQWWADKTIRGLEIHAFWIDDSPGLVAANDAMVEAEIADREADALTEPTQAMQIVIAAGGNGPAGLIGIAPTNDETDAGDVDDDRCQSWIPGEFAPGRHKCELYGTHPEADHVCLCGHQWPNAAAVVPPPAVMSEPCDECESTGRNCRAHSIPGAPGRSIEDVPAPREAAE